MQPTALGAFWCSAVPGAQRPRRSWRLWSSVAPVLARFLALWLWRSIARCCPAMHHSSVCCLLALSGIWCLAISGALALWRSCAFSLGVSVVSLIFRVLPHSCVCVFTCWCECLRIICSYSFVLVLAALLVQELDIRQLPLCLARSVVGHSSTTPLWRSGIRGMTARAGRHCSEYGLPLSAVLAPS